MSIRSRFPSRKDRHQNFQLAVLNTPFYRNKAAYIVGRAINGADVIPFVIPILNNGKGQAYVDTLLVEEGAPDRDASTVISSLYGEPTVDGEELDIVAAVDRLKDGMKRVFARTSSYVSRAANERMQAAKRKWAKMGAPEELSHKVAVLTLTRAATDIVDVAAERKRDVIDSARLYARFNDELEIHWLHNSAEDLKVQGRWQAQARSNLREQIYCLRRQLALKLLKPRSKRDPRKIVDEWLATHEQQVADYKGTLEEMRLRGKVDFATLSVAAQELEKLIAT